MGLDRSRSTDLYSLLLLFDVVATIDADPVCPAAGLLDNCVKLPGAMVTWSTNLSLLPAEIFEIKGELLISAVAVLLHSSVPTRGTNTIIVLVPLVPTTVVTSRARLAIVCWLGRGCSLRKAAQS
jgi:hypothetical protein